MKQDKWRRISKTPELTVHKSATRPATYYVAWIKAPRRYGQRVYQAPDDREAVRMAPMIAGLVAAPERRAMIALDQAFEEALAASRRGKTARADWNVAVRSFVVWLVEHHNHAGAWNALSRAIIRQYKTHCAGLGLSANGVRMRLQPIQQTDRHMAAEHGFPRITEGLDLRRNLKTATASIYIADALALVATLPGRLQAPAALQAFAGLRLQEAYRLTWDRVDLRRGLIEVSGQVKNEWSRRVIPIGSTALAYLQAAPRPKVRDIAAPDALVPDFETWSGYAVALRDAIRDWNPAVTWTGKDLRNVLPTWAATSGQRSDLLEMYLGHAPASVTMRHYVPRLANVTSGERDELDRAMDLFRAQVVAPFEAAISDVKEKEKAKKVPGSSTREAATS